MSILFADTESVTYDGDEGKLTAPELTAKIADLEGQFAFTGHELQGYKILLAFALLKARPTTETILISPARKYARKVSEIHFDKRSLRERG